MIAELKLHKNNFRVCAGPKLGDGTGGGGGRWVEGGREEDRGDGGMGMGGKGDSFDFTRSHSNGLASLGERGWGKGVGIQRGWGLG